MNDPALSSYTLGTLPWYKRAYQLLTFDPGFDKEVEAAGKRVLAGKSRYVPVGLKLGIPWQLVGCLHNMEASCSFKGCMHNGDLIIGTGKKTTHVPKGKGPFATWEESAVDALSGLKCVSSWPVEEILHQAEKYNGLAYVHRGIVSPYVFSQTNICPDHGKYVADGEWDSEAPANGQTGVAAILKWLEGQGEFDPGQETHVDVTHKPDAPGLDQEDTLLHLATELGLEIPAHALIDYRNLRRPNSHPTYWAIFSIGEHSKNKRLHIFNVIDSTVKSYHCAHGSGSDPENTGMASIFSNEEGSNCSSLGIYLVSETYVGKHGLSCRLDGLEPTNSNARSRDVVLHSAPYATDAWINENGHCGRSNGCTAVGDEYRSEVINALKGGSLMIVWKA